MPKSTLQGLRIEPLSSGQPWAEPSTRLVGLDVTPVVLPAGDGSEAAGQARVWKSEQEGELT